MRGHGERTVYHMSGGEAAIVDPLSAPAVGQFIAHELTFDKTKGLRDMAANMAKKINTSFNLHLDKIGNYPHHLADEHKEYKAITIRNLIRGCCLKLPTGQSVARQLGEEPMAGTAITDGETDEVKAALHGFEHDTPLWFYILKEAKEKGDGGNRLGPVGSRIVAETFYAIIKYSAHSILDEHDRLTEAEMLPRRQHDKPDKFDMVDMLTFMGELNPTLYD